MSKDKPKNDSITIPEFIPVFEKIGGLNASPLDYRLLKNLPSHSSSNSSQVFMMDIFSISGATGDAVYRDVNLIGANGDRSVTYSQEIIVGRGSTTAQISKEHTCNVVSNQIVIPPSKVGIFSALLDSATQLIKLEISGTYKHLEGTSLNINNTNNRLTIWNTGTTDCLLKIKFATTGSEMPKFGVFIQVI